MIDIHSHILPNVDDGPNTKEETIQMIKEAYKAGFTDIVATSHYISDSYNCNKKERELLISNLQEKLYESDINVKLYIGAEGYVSADLDTLIKDDIVPTLNNSRYVLFELPMNTKILFLDYVIDKLINMNLVPIIAHPERYSYIDNKMLQQLIKKGVLFQSNFGSLTGMYGNRAKKVANKLIKDNMIHFLATDAHKPNSIYCDMEDILKILIEKYGKEKIQLLAQMNPKCIIDNEKITKVS